MENIAISKNGNGSAAQNGNQEALRKELEALRNDREQFEELRYIDSNLTKLAAATRWGIEQTPESWADELLGQLAEAVGALQAAFYSYNESRQELRLLAGFACPADVQKTIKIGEGLAGQVAKNRESVSYADQAAIYARNYSSLSEFEAKFVIIQPLIYNDELLGLVEISATKTLPKRDVELIQALSENVAASLHTINNQQQIKELYREAQEKSEALQAQEEELRQNLEELQATQEQMRLAQRRADEQRAEIKGIIDSSKDSIVALDQEFRITHFNEQNRALLEANGIEIYRGMPAEEMVAPGEWPKLKPLWARALSGEQFSEETSYEFENSDTVYYFELNYSPIKNENGDAFGAVLFARDITVQKQYGLDIQKKNEELEAQQEELRQNLEELEATQEEMKRAQARLSEEIDRAQGILDNSSENILALDLDYRVTHFNQTYEAFMAANGVTFEKGSQAEEMVATEAWPELRKMWDLAFSGKTFTQEFPYQFAPGEPSRIYRMTYAPVKNPSGEVIGAVTYASDVTEEKQKEEAFNAYKSELEGVADLMAKGFYTIEIGLDGRITYLNDKVRGLFDKANEQLIGKKIGAFAQFASEEEPNVPIEFFDKVDFFQGYLIPETNVGDEERRIAVVVQKINAGNGEPYKLLVVGYDCPFAK